MQSDMLTKERVMDELRLHQNSYLLELRNTDLDFVARWAGVDRT